MYNIYGLYKSVRNNSWKFIIDFNISSLPVDLNNICKNLDIKVMSYEQASEFFEILNINDLALENDGFCLYFNNKWLIFYNNKIENKGRIRFTIAHELGHILLGHKIETKQNKFFRLQYSKSNIDMWDNTPIERDANMFAIRILAPATVLHKINISNAHDIKNICDISYTAAKYRAERMQLLLKRNMFDTHPLEKQVLHQFQAFIDEYNNNHT